MVAGNHDLDSSTDDQRGRTPYLDTFGPRRYRSSPSFRGASPDGYNTYHTFRAAGRKWLVLALDWRPSAKGIAWAREVARATPELRSSSPHTSWSTRTTTARRRGSPTTDSGCGTS